VNFIVRKTIECNESEMNEKTLRSLQFNGMRAVLILYARSHQTNYLLPEKSRSLRDLNEVKRNFDGSLKAS